MRVGIVALLHESNTFIARPTTIDDFRQNLCCRGAAVREAMAETHHEVGGFFQGLSEEKIEAVPLSAARAVPYGTVCASAFAELLDEMWEALEAAGSLDGILAAPHGATVSEEHPDADGYWLTELRKRVGPDMPIVATLDAHANVSQAMIDPCNAVVAYRSNPHLDQRARGVEAARLMAGALRGEIQPVTEAAFPPLAINIERQLTSEPHLTPLYELADEQLRREERLLSNSILLGFPYADVAEMGSSVLAVADGDRAAARRAADELAMYLWNHRDDFVGRMLSIEESIGRARKVDGPVCLLDMGDNVGGGSPADSTILAHALRESGLKSFVCLYDPEMESRARAAGVGAAIDLTIGGKTDDGHGAPLSASCIVLGLYDGKFEEPEPRHGGFTRCDQGPTAVVQSGDMTVMLTSQRMPPFSIRQLTTFGVDPQAFQVLVAKGVNAPVAAYAPVCAELIRVDTPGVTTADMESLTFHRRRKPLFPFERGFEFSAG